MSQEINKYIKKKEINPWEFIQWEVIIIGIYVTYS